MRVVDGRSVIAVELRDGWAVKVVAGDGCRRRIGFTCSSARVFLSRRWKAHQRQSWFESIGGAHWKPRTPAFSRPNGGPAIGS